MALTYICCPNCATEIRIELHVFNQANDSKQAQLRRGPTPVYLGEEVETLIVNAIEVEGLSYREVSTILMRRRMKTPRGGDTWYPATVQRQYRKVLRRRMEETEQKVSTT